MSDDGEITADERWTKGDFELISSDGVRFLVPTLVLTYNSPVFLDMTGVGQGPSTVTFMDTVIETSTIIRLFLLLAADGPLNVTGEGADFVHLGAFLRKYDFQNLHAQLTLIVRHAAITGPSIGIGITTAFAFAFAVQEKDTHTLFAALASNSAWHGKDAVLDGVDGDFQIDPLTWPLPRWKLGIDPKAIFALAHTWREVGRKEQGERQKIVCETYVKYRHLAEMYEKMGYA